MSRRPYGPDDGRHSSRHRRARDDRSERRLPPPHSTRGRSDSYRRVDGPAPGRRRSPPPHWRDPSPPHRRRRTPPPMYYLRRSIEGRRLEESPPHPSFRRDGDPCGSSSSSRRRRHEEGRSRSRRDSVEERPRRVAPTPPPGFGSRRSSREEGEVKDDDYEDGEWVAGERRRNRGYRENFCPPVKAEMDDETMIHFSRNQASSSKKSSPPKEHPVIQELLKLEKGRRPTKPKAESSSSTSTGADPPPPPPKKASSAIADEVEKSLDELKEADQVGEAKAKLTLAHLRQHCEHQLLDKAFMSHLSDINPISALHEMAQRLGWAQPNMKVAFEFGPPTMKMYIYKVVINGEEFQPAVAVDNKKDAKANAALFALQEVGFIKADASNPL